MNNKILSRGIVFGASLALLTACGGGGGGSGSGGTDDSGDNGSQDPSFSSLIVDASATDSYTYLNLSTGQLVDVENTESLASSTWHIAFQRNRIKLNGGASGEGNVAASLAVEQDDFYDDQGEPDTSVFLNATPDSEEEHLLGQIAADGLEYVQDAKLAALSGSGEMTGTTMNMGWYNYDVASHVLSVNRENGWIVRSAEGTSYAKLTATALDYDRTGSLTVTFNFDVEPSAGDGFTTVATFNADVPATGGQQCFDFDSNAVADCSGSTWDAMLEVNGRDLHIWTNGGITGSGNAGVVGPFDQDELATYDSGGDLPDVLYTTDAGGGLFLDNPWYAYNLSGGHKLWPNYRVYVIDTDTEDASAPRFKLQVTNYYSDAGASGYPNIRFMQLEEN